MMDSPVLGRISAPRQRSFHLLYYGIACGQSSRVTAAIGDEVLSLLAEKEQMPLSNFHRISAGVILSPQAYDLRHATFELSKYLNCVDVSRDTFGIT